MLQLRFRTLTGTVPAVATYDDGMVVVSTGMSPGGVVPACSMPFHTISDWGTAGEQALDGPRKFDPETIRVNDCDPASVQEGEIQSTVGGFNCAAALETPASASTAVRKSCFRIEVPPSLTGSHPS